MIRLGVQALRLTAVFTMLTGVAYPLVVTGVAHLIFPERAGGSLVRRGGEVVGSALLAQRFTSPRYFWPRPSAGDFGTVPSAASNLGPTSRELRSNVTKRGERFRAANGLPDGAEVPGDAVLASGSGLDPHISPLNARLQTARVAEARQLPREAVERLVADHIEGPQGVWGESRVNVLLLNLALDAYDGASP